MSISTHGATFAAFDGMLCLRGRTVHDVSQFVRTPPNYAIKMIGAYFWVPFFLRRPAISCRAQPFAQGSLPGIRSQIFSGAKQTHF